MTSPLGVTYTVRPSGKRVEGVITVCGVDISHRVSAVHIDHDASGLALLRVDIPLRDGDDLDIEVPPDSFVVREYVHAKIDREVAAAV